MEVLKRPISSGVVERRHSTTAAVGARRKSTSVLASALDRLFDFGFNHIPIARTSCQRHRDGVRTEAEIQPRSNRDPAEIQPGRSSTPSSVNNPDSDWNSTSPHHASVVRNAMYVVVPIDQVQYQQSEGPTALVVE
jgi:hypothetical protein